MMLVTLLIASLTVSVTAISSGKVSLCDATPDVYGCVPDGWDLNDDGSVNRKSCQDKSRIMAWATAPVKDEEAYRLYVGDDEENTLTSYVPGKHYNVHLRVRQYNRQYRGLLMYVVDENEEKVGDWDFKDRAEIFHSFCPKSVLHASGTDKPYLSTWGFTAPPAGTGTIKFRSLIKTGVANVGDFWYANDLELTEAPAEDVSQRWYKSAEPGQTCTQVCAANCQTCVESELKDVNSVATLEELVAPFTTCSLPYLARCGSEGPAASKDGLCFYRDEEFCAEKGLTVQATSCDAEPSGPDEVAYRLCPCDGIPCTTAPTPAPTSPPTPAPAGGGIMDTTLPSSCADGEAKIGCPCPDAGCSDDQTCTANICTPKYSCLYGEAGCPCELETAACGSGLACSPESNTCLVEYRNDCDERIGELGCWCTTAKGCLSDDLYCDHTENCVLKAAVCVAGNVGCPCDEDQCSFGLSCAKFNDESVCAVIDGDITAQETTGASSLVASLAALVVCVAAMFA